MADRPEIAIVLPVGPKPVHRAYLDKCFESIANQTVEVAQMMVVVDGGDWQMRGEIQQKMVDAGVTGLRYWALPFMIPWTVGPADAWNIGIAEAKPDLCFMMGGDDWLEPTCVERLGDAWAEHQDHLGYYSVTIRYDDDRPDPLQALPCNAAMVHKRLWNHLGGFPIETATGACDAALISIMLAHPEAGHLIRVAEGEPLYNVRVHPGQDTAMRRPWQGVVHATRDILTEQWRPRRG